MNNKYPFEKMYGREKNTEKEDIRLKKIIQKLTIYLHRINNGMEADTFRGLIHELNLDYIEAIELGLLEFNNEVSDLEDRLKGNKDDRRNQNESTNPTNPTNNTN